MKVIIQNAMKSKIYKLRGHFVMLDRDLGEFYEEETRRINEVRKRNESKFIDESFQITKEEYEDLSISQSAILPPYKGGHMPWVYTERGAYKLSIHLNSAKANQISDIILDAFFMVRDYFRSNPAGNLPREGEILRNQLQKVETDLKGPAPQVVHNYYAPVHIFQQMNQTTNVSNDIELIARLFLLKEQSLEPTVSVALEDAAKAVQEKDEGKVKKSLDIINGLMDTVSKTSKAYTILKPAYDMIKVFFGL